MKSAKRKPGFYWVRYGTGKHVAEWYIGMGSGSWHIPRCIRQYSDDDVKVLSDRLTPPKRGTGPEAGR